MRAVCVCVCERERDTLVLSFRRVGVSTWFHCLLLSIADSSPVSSVNRVRWVCVCVCVY